MYRYYNLNYTIEHYKKEGIYMKKEMPIIGIGIILMTIALSGCQEEAVTTERTFEGIFFESNILELTNASLDLTKGKDGAIVRAEAIFYFRNKLDKGIANLKFSIEFCDKNNNVLHSRPYQYNTIFPAGYSESSASRVPYIGDNVGYTDHVNIITTNYNIVE